ncbi:hypothetical protein ACFZBU_41065 [Embleya sp. NPDC008237]|uniref:hypothetical protein n=1 Tax=Embleya sp. NPDC008237 TaxID=3363978 RepID=UPI0036F09FDE
MYTDPPVGRLVLGIAAAIRASGRRCPCCRPLAERWVTVPRLALLMVCAHGNGQWRARWWVERPGRWSANAHLARALSARVPAVP